MKLFAKMAALATGTILAVAPLSVAADEVLASRLGALLGSESRALTAVPDVRLAALTSLPSVEDRKIATAPSNVSYNDSFLNALGSAGGGSEWECLSEALYFEARGESVEGLFGVGEVILNRVDSGAYPNTICGVINQGTGRKYACQFTYTCDGIPDHINNQAAYSRVGKVARLLIDGASRELTDGATHYHTTAVSPSWARRFPLTAHIGVHRFYRQPTRSASN
jgi:hypothetical protein